MKYAKMLGLLALAAAALMAFAGSASAKTTLTDKVGNVVPLKTVLHSENEGVVKLDGPLVIECSKSTVQGETDDYSSAATGETLTGEIDELTFEECGSRTITVLKRGTLEIHTEKEIANGNGTLTSSGAEITVLAHLPFNVTVHCRFGTEGTDIGQLTGSKNTGKTATLDITGKIPVLTPSFACGENPAQWTGSYSVTSPDYLDVD
jgi:hypothetical protein